MRNKSGFIPIDVGMEQAIALVPEFKKVVHKMEPQVIQKRIKIKSNFWYNADRKTRRNAIINGQLCFAQRYCITRIEQNPHKKSDIEAIIKKHKNYWQQTWRA